MKFLIMLLFVISCSAEHRNFRTNNPTPPIVDNWIVIGTATIGVKIANGQMYATQNETITYTSADTTNFSLDVSGLASPAETLDSAVLDFGQFNVDTLKVNKLKVCGVGLDEKCTSSIIRLYTTEVTGHTGIAGFVNKDDGYGVDIKAGETTASGTVGLTVTNALTVDQYTIPASDRKLRANDFSGTTYELEVDFSNAGAGSYEMNLVIELAVGL